MSLKQIECVVMAAKLKSFTKAANKLKIAQPSLSQSILQSPRGLIEILPTLGPSGKQERLNC